VFSSSASIWDQDEQHRSLEVQTRHGGAAWARAHATCAHLSLVVPLACFFFSCSFFRKNINARKILAPYEFRKVRDT
jgi:hypothetical protein